MTAPAHRIQKLLHPLVRKCHKNISQFLLILFLAAQSAIVYKNLQNVMVGNKPGKVYDGYASCPLVTGYNSCILAEFDYNLKPMETFPISQDKEMYSMYLMKKDIMPILYWQLMLNGYWNGPGIFRKVLNPLAK